jgi:hypothetical protein
MSAAFNLIAISRIHSTTIFSSGVITIKTDYTLDKLTEALAGQAAVVCVVGPAGMVHYVTLIDVFEVAGVKRFIIDDFGWGPDVRGFQHGTTYSHTLRRRD